ncbi:MAG: c-type cytochrome [Nitrospira sp.]|nr:c-type cytochrome [Nitrospira sp.]MCP9473928.1 c-type cytochrome [Nitrospira sp.]
MRRHRRFGTVARIGMLGLSVAVALPLFSVVQASAESEPTRSLQDLLRPFFGGEKETAATKTSGGVVKLPQLQGLEDPNTYVPADNPLTADKVELGRILFFDKRLSKNNTIACASCHMADKGFTDGMPVSTGINGLKGGRSAPASFNRVFSKAQFWDGRAATLEDQSIGPFINPVEHGFANHDEMIAKMKQIPGYRKLFQDVFGREINIQDVGRAIASFQRTILSGNSPVDKFDIGGDEKALSESAKRGLELFRGKARCTRCHSGFNFTDEKFHNLGIGWDTNTVDLGRYMETKNPEDVAAFKTPTLREIARTAPYMHDGRFKTLEEVVEFYNKGGIKNPFLDNTIIPLELTEQEKQDLVAMLKSLNGEGWQHVSEPKSFPK